MGEFENGVDSFKGAIEDEFSGMFGEDVKTVIAANAFSRIG